MRSRFRPRIRIALAAGLAASLVAACTVATGAIGTRATSESSTSPSVRRSQAAPTSRPAPSNPRAPGEFTFAFAGDVHFAERVAARLQADPTTVFAEATPSLEKADLTMVNLETAITERGTPAPKEFHFRAPATAFTALRAAGVDIATMANNHAVDYGEEGLADSLAAIRTSRFPVVGIGADATAAYAAWTTNVRGVRVAVLAASQVQDETLANWTADTNSPGIANAYSDQLVAAVQRAKRHADVVIVYVHWGTEYTTCPNSDQKSLADKLAAAGATAIVGTHAHELQGAGWRPDGAYVAYGLGNYLWWRSFGNLQDDNGVLTLTFRDNRVVTESFSPAHLDERGIPVPARGTEKQRIDQEWEQDRTCAGLAARPPR